MLTLLNADVNESNLNNFGRFDALKESVDKTKAKVYFEKLDGMSLSLFKLNMRINQFLKQFIFAQADDLLNDAIDVLGDVLE